MAYIGNSAANQTFTPIIDTFNGNGSTTAFTLTYPVASVAQVEAYISNVPQQPGVAYTVLGNTITFTSAPPSGTANIYVRYTSPITQIMQPGQGTVGTTQMMDAAVTAAKIASGQVLPAAGIKFPTTQSASSNANTLDDYEEGTFTPTISATSGGSFTGGTAAGYYTKIGNLVTCAIYLQNYTVSGASGSSQVGGLPFAGFSYNRQWIPSPAAHQCFSIPGGVYWINGYINSNTTITWYGMRSAGSWVDVPYSNQSATYIELTFSYLVST